MTAIAHLTHQHIATADVPTRNGHIYPMAVLEPLTQLPPHSIRGQLGMPREAFALHDVSHAIAALYFEGAALYADVDILDTTAGHELVDRLHIDNICFRLDGDAQVTQVGEHLIVDGAYHLRAINAVPAAVA